MKTKVLNWLNCPECKNDLKLNVIHEKGLDVLEGELICGCGKVYPVINGLPRFVEDDGYTKSFSFEWNLHRKTQLDASKSTVSKTHFLARTGFDLKDLKGKLVFDAGVGMGRFAEIAAKAGATVIGADISYSVDAASKNLRNFQNVHLLQADIFKLPFKKETFDYIYCIGVLHNTPNAKEAFKKLPPLLKKGGTIATWVHTGYRSFPPSDRVLRRITPKLNHKVLYGLCCIFASLYYLFNATTFQKRFWHYLLPGFMFHLLPTVSDKKNLKWRILNTFNDYSTQYLSFHKYPEVYSWYKESGLSEIELRDPEISLSGQRPLNQSE